MKGWQEYADFWVLFGLSVRHYNQGHVSGLTGQAQSYGNFIGQASSLGSVAL